jgi:hypothetical protein
MISDMVILEVVDETKKWRGETACLAGVFSAAQPPDNLRARVDALTADRVAQLVRKAAEKEGQSEPEFFHGVLF